jgi:ABC-type oligopeptide transport system substrate-binding subunit
VIASLTSGRKITYTRNPNYWGFDLPINKGQWNFDAVSYDYYRDDDVAFEAFKSGAFDVRRESDPLLWVNGYDGPSFARGDTIKRPMPHQRPEPLRGFIFNTRRAVFSSPAVRQAIAIMFDFEWVNRTLYAGNYQRIDSLFPNSELSAHAAPDNSTAPMRIRIKQAFELLDADGWRMQNGQMLKNGAPLSFEILLVDARDEKIALTLVRGLKKLGILARVRTVDSAQYQARLTEFDYDMILHFWSSTLSPGNEQMSYWGSAAADQPGSRNYAGVKSAKVDSLVHALMETRTRQELISAAQALDRAVLSQHIIIPIGYLGKDLLATRKGLAFPTMIPIYGAMPEQTAWWDTLKDKQQ